MDGHIQEDTAGNSSIFGRWRLGVAGRDFDKLELADLAFVDQLTDMGKVVVKAAVETDLQLDAGFLDGFDDGKDLFRGQVDRLFAEHMLACPGRFDGDVGVGIGGRADEHGVDCGIGEHRLVVGINLFNAVLCSERRQRILEHVGDTEHFGSGHGIGDGFHVDFADTAGTDDADVELFHLIASIMKILRWTGRNADLLIHCKV